MCYPENPEQQNEVQKQLLPRERHEEDVDRGHQVMVGRPLPDGMINTKWEKTFKLEKACIEFI